MSRRIWLRTLLDRYEPSSAREARDLARMLELLEAAGDPFSRTHFVPGHFTASAFVISADGRSVLLVHHRKLDRWLQPGGHVEVEDVDLIASARREVREETGLGDLELCRDGVFDVDIHVFPVRDGQPEHEHFDVRFLFRCADGSDPGVGDEVHSARWFRVDSLGATPKVAANLDRPIGKLM